MQKSSSHISVLLCTEGTYPFHQGGVSTWCDTLVRRLKDLDYTVYSIVTDPFVTQKFTLPKGTKLLKLPLWGTDEPSEHLDVPFSSTYLAKQRTTPEVVQTRFLPIFDEFITELMQERKNSQAFAETLLKLSYFFEEFDYKVAFKSQHTWNRYRQLMESFSTGLNPIIAEPDLYGLIQSLGWVYRFFNIVNTRVPETTVTHAAAAAFCGIPGVIAKLKYNTPLLLTEHGVYTREQYLSLSKRGYSSFLNTFLIRMVYSVIKVTYAYADQISPVCDYNTRWERRLTDRHERIQVIYNGVDHRVFARLEPREHSRPTVVTVARIDPIKDIITLIRTADIVRRDVPDVRFIVYGSTTVPEYGERCVALVEELGLGGTVEFFGHTSDMASAYDSGDIVVQSSISEAFPYSVIEAMMSSKPVISTDVGGVAEAIGETGVLVTPGRPDQLAKAIVQLLSDKQARMDLGQQARTRALDLFTLDKCLELYLKTYIKLAITRGQPLRAERPVRKQPSALKSSRRFVLVRPATKSAWLAMERAMALLTHGAIENAVHQFEIAWRQTETEEARQVASAFLTLLHHKLAEREVASQVAHGVFNRTERTLATQHLLAERAFALADNGHWHAAVEQINAAVSLWPNSAATPVLLETAASWLELLGDVQAARVIRIKSDLAATVLSESS